MMIIEPLPAAPVDESGAPRIKEFQVIISQPKSYNALGMEIAGKPLTMIVPREEFFSVVLHYKGRNAWRTLLNLELLGKAHTLAISLPDITIIEYQNAMFRGGRWRDS